MDHFQKLPDEMLLKVFSFLGANSLLQCRRVSKRFKLWVDDLALKELVIKGNETDYNSCCSWYHTGGSVDPSDFLCGHRFYDPMMQQEILDLFKRLPLNLTKLQRIKIATFNLFGVHHQSRHNGRKLIRILNKFVELEHLEMNVLLDLGKETVLRLPILRILLINAVSHDLVIDAPRLTVLCCRMGLERVKVTTPETVKQIELQYGIGNLEGYCSVEMFRCKCPERLTINIIDQILEFCPELRQLHIEKPDYQGYLHGLSEGILSYAYTKELVHHLLAQKDRLKCENLDAYLFGIKLSDAKFEQQVPADDPVFARPYESKESDDDYFEYSDHSYDLDDYENEYYDDGF